MLIFAILNKAVFKRHIYNSGYLYILAIALTRDAPKGHLEKEKMDKVELRGCFKSGVNPTISPPKNFRSPDNAAINFAVAFYDALVAVANCKHCNSANMSNMGCSWQLSCSCGRQ